MIGPGSPEEQPIFAHHVRALLARLAQKDRELVGAAYRRGRFRQQDLDRDVSGSVSLPLVRSHGSGGGGTNFHIPSPLTGRDRQTGPTRVPHFDMKPMTRSYVPTSKNGEVHPRHKAAAMEAADHFDYVTNGAVITIGKHLDYIRRDSAVEHLEEELVIDMLDEQELRREQNIFGIYSNILGGRERQRSLFEAAERSEREPKTHYLTASTADLGRFETIARFAIAPPWLRDIERRLRAALREAERKAAAKGKAVRHAQVEVAEVTPEEAFDRLAWLGQYRAAPALNWKQGRTGRSHYRFVLELPEGITPAERHRILRAFCDMLANDGWMLVGAIHQPDPHGDKRNFHIHVDGYDRPAQWLDEHNCWDFEHVVRRNGKDTFPDRQKKVRYEAPPGTSGKAPKV